MELELKGKVAIVTGGARGIGRIICRTLAEEGVNVTIADVLNEKGLDYRDAEGRSTEDVVRTLGSKALYVRTDVSKLEDTQKMVKATLETFGSVDILVNVAGVWWLGYFWQQQEQDWLREIDVNLRGTINCCSAVVDPMIKKDAGMIVNVISDAGRTGDTRQATYGGTKAGIAGFSRGLARDLGRHNINVNCVSPGATLAEHIVRQFEQVRKERGEEAWATFEARILERYPLRKFGKPEDIANAVVFLSSKARAGHITGQTLSVSGGFVMI